MPDLISFSLKLDGDVQKKRRFIDFLPALYAATEFDRLLTVEGISLQPWSALGLRSFSKQASPIRIVDDHFPTAISLNPQNCNG